MEKHSSPKGLDNDGRNHYETLGKGLTYLKSGIEYGRKKLSNINERVDRAVCNAFTNDPTSSSRIRRNRGTILKIAVIPVLAAVNYGISRVVGNYLGYIGDNTIVKISGPGGHVEIQGQPYELYRNVTSTTGLPPYPPTDYQSFRENIGKNAELFFYSIFGGLAGVEVLGFGVHEKNKNRKLEKMLNEQKKQSA